MSSIVLIIGQAGPGSTPHDGRYVVAWNPHTAYGTLECTSTADVAKAHRFDGIEAFQAWNTVSSVQPTRPDGRPNKPLTALTIDIMAEPTFGQNTRPGVQ